MPNFAEQSDKLTEEEAPRGASRDNLERVSFRATVVVLATLAGA